MRLVVPAQYDATTRSTLFSRAKDALAEASAILHEVSGVTLAVEESVTWTGSPKTMDANALSMKFPLQVGVENPVTFGLLSISQREAKQYHAGHTRAFAPWIILSLITDAKPSQEPWMVRNDAYTILHEWTHLIGGPHTRTKKGKESSFMNKELEGKFHVSTGRFSSSASYINTGDRSSLYMDDLTKALLPLGRDIHFFGTCAFWPRATLQRYLSIIERHEDQIELNAHDRKTFLRSLEKEKGEHLPSRTEIMNGLVVALFNTAADQVQREDLSEVHSCLRLLEEIEASIRAKPSYQLSRCVQKSYDILTFNQKATALNRRIIAHNRGIHAYNETHDRSEKRRLKRTVGKEAREIDLAKKDLQELEKKTRASSPCDQGGMDSLLSH